MQQIPRILCNTQEVPHSYKRYFSTTRCVVLHASLHVTSWRRIASPKPNKRYDISDTKKRSKRAKRALRMADKAAGRRLATLALHHHMMITNVTFLRRGKHIMSKELLIQWASCKGDTLPLFMLACIILSLTIPESYRPDFSSWLRFFCVFGN